MNKERSNPVYWMILLIILCICLIFIIASFQNRAHAQNYPDILHFGPNDAQIISDLHLQYLYGQVDNATVSDVAGNFTTDNLEWILDYLADAIEATAVEANDTGIVNVSDVVVIGSNNWEYILPDWDDPDSNYYDKRFREVKYAKIRHGGEYTPYIILLSGMTQGSHRGVRVNLAENETFTEPWEIDMLAFLETVGGADYRTLRGAAQAFGLVPETVVELNKFGNNTGRY